MKACQPLSDADRWDWLILLRNIASQRLQTSRSVVVSCSALRRKYRDVLRMITYEQPSVHVHFVYLNVDAKVLRARVASRQGHFMKLAMVESQLDILEEPAKDEYDVLSVDCGDGNDQEGIQNSALDMVNRELAKYVCWAATW